MNSRLNLYIAGVIFPTYKPDEEINSEKAMKIKCPNITTINTVVKLK